MKGSQLLLKAALCLPQPVAFVACLVYCEVPFSAALPALHKGTEMVRLGTETSVICSGSSFYKGENEFFFWANHGGRSHTNYGGNYFIISP